MIIKTDMYVRSNAVELGVSYSKGGMSYFTGESHKRGYDVTFRPVQKSEGSSSFMLFDENAFRLHIEDANRLSQKRLGELRQVLEDNAGLIITAVQTGDKNIVGQMLKKIFNIY
jgi:hypothetical protein